MSKSFSKIRMIVISLVIIAGLILSWKAGWAQKVEDETADWKIYRNERYGFEFKYPTVPLGCEQCKTYESSDGFSVNRTDLAIEDSGGVSFPDFVNKEIGEFSIEKREEKLIGGRKGIVIDYRFGGMNRFGRVAFVERKNKIFIFSFTAGGFCCSSKVGRIYEADVFGAMLSTFRFSEGKRI